MGNKEDMFSEYCNGKKIAEMASRTNEFIELVRNIDEKPITIRKRCIIAVCKVNDTVKEIYLSNGSSIRVTGLSDDLISEL